MKKLILLLVAIVTISCKQQTYPPVASKIVSTSPANIEHLMEEVNFGLNKVKVNDSTTVLIYRGTESCTMIQLK